MNADKMKIEILDDGLIRITTDGVSQANHVGAEGFLKLLAQLAGGTTTRTRRKEAHTHSHSHGSDHHHH